MELQELPVSNYNPWVVAGSWGASHYIHIYISMNFNMEFCRFDNR